jgi:hypothetical protein
MLPSSGSEINGPAKITKHNGQIEQPVPGELVLQIRGK